MTKALHAMGKYILFVVVGLETEADVWSVGQSAGPVGDCLVTGGGKIKDVQLLCNMQMHRKDDRGIS